jgi:hypothetical protein
MLASMARFGRMGASFPIFVEPPPPWYEVVPCEELLDRANLSTYFERSISEWTQHPEEEDVRAAASRFLRRFCGSIAAAALIPLANGIAWDVSIGRVSVIIRKDMTLGTVLDLDGADIFTSPERPTTWPLEDTTPLPTAAALREKAFKSLFGDHFVPAFARVLDVVKVSPRLIWTTAAESIELLYEYARPYYDKASFEPLAEDREAIHFGATIPGVDGPNPMLGMVEWETFDDPLLPDPVQLRRVCCVNYVVPGRNPSYCRTCGLLSAEERHQQWQRYVIAAREATSCAWPPVG